MNLTKYNLILASKSPRRKELLEQAGFTFEIFSKEVEENYPESLPIEEVAVYLAVKKARESIEVLKKDSILLTADSVVIINKEIYGKPQNEKEAYNMLSSLSGKSHIVITGVCLKSLTKEVSFSSTSEVTMDKLNDEEIKYYVDKYKPYDKAGAYGVQEWIGLCKISGIKGTYTNIMGLPVDLVYKHLKESF